MQKAIISFFLGLVFLSSTGPFTRLAAADAGAPAHGKSSFWANALGKLDLTDSQRKQLEELRETSRVEKKKAFGELGALHDTLREKLSSQPPQEEQRNLYAEIEQKSTAIHRNKFERMLKVRAILTPEQRRQLMEMDPHKHGNVGPRGKDGDCAERED
jgi:Spy/CpxP family protein refolding chaperone